MTATFAVAAESQRAAQIAFDDRPHRVGTPPTTGPKLPAAGRWDCSNRSRPTGGAPSPKKRIRPTLPKCSGADCWPCPTWSTMLPWAPPRRSNALGAGAASDGAANYGPHWAPAGVYLAVILANGNTSGSCGQGIPRGVTGPDHGLPAGYTIPAGTGAAHAQVVTYAVAQRVAMRVGRGRPKLVRLLRADHGRLGHRRYLSSPLHRRPAKRMRRRNRGNARTRRPGSRPSDPISPAPGIAGHVGILGSASGWSYPPSIRRWGWRCSRGRRSSPAG